MGVTLCDTIARRGRAELRGPIAHLGNFVLPRLAERPVHAGIGDDHLMSSRPSLDLLLPVSRGNSVCAHFPSSSTSSSSSNTKGDIFPQAGSDRTCKSSRTPPLCVLYCPSDSM